MKRFFEYIVKIITQAGLIFSLTILAYTLIHGFLVEWQVTATAIFQLALVSLLCAAIQFVFFSGVVICKMGYNKRILLSLPVFLILVLAAALLFDWFPADKLGAWFAFFGIFVLVFVGILLGFEIYFRITGRKYDDLLTKYKNREYKE